MFAKQDINFVQDSQTAANIVISINDLYKNVRKICSKALSLSLGSPILIFAYFFLIAINRKFKKIASRDIHITLSNYKDLKHQQAKFNTIAHKLERINNLDVKKTPFILRGFLIQVRKLSINIDRYRIALNIAINNLDKADKGAFRVIPENKLWQKRVQVYDYLA